MYKEKYINKHEVLDFGEYYHVYNKAVGSELLFKTEKDYYYFLNKFDRYLILVLLLKFILIVYCPIISIFLSGLKKIQQLLTT